MPQHPLELETWARFAAAALQAVIVQRGELHKEAFTLRFHESAEEAAKYADALSREWARRFFTEVGK